MAVDADALGEAGGQPAQPRPGQHAHARTSIEPRGDQIVQHCHLREQALGRAVVRYEQHVACDTMGDRAERDGAAIHCHLAARRGHETSKSPRYHVRAGADLPSNADDPATRGDHGEAVQRVGYAQPFDHHSNTIV